MDEQQSETKKADWNDFLDKIANETDGLVLKHPKVKEKFREQIRPFAERWKKHNGEEKKRDRGRLKHWEKVKQNPAWQHKEAGPPKKGWEWDDYYLLVIGSEYGPVYEMPAKYGTALVAAIKKYLENNYRKIQEIEKEQTSIVGSSEYWNLRETIERQELDIKEIQDQLDKLNPEQRNTSWIRTPPLLEKRRTGSNERSYTRIKWWEEIGLAQEAVFGCYRSPVKEPIRNPVECLIPIKQDDHPISSMEWDAERKLPELKNGADEYERYYVTLTAIHDNRLSVTSTRIADKSIWPKELAEQLWFRFTDAQPYGPNKTFIEQALEHVKHDLREVGLLDNRKDILNVDSGGDTGSRQAASGQHPQGTLQDRAVKVESLFRDSENNMATFRDRDRKWYELYKKNEQEKKTDAMDSLSPPKLPDWYGNTRLEQVYAIHRIEDEAQPSDDLRALARYVKLTILHDTKLPLCERINDGIWSDDEQWVKDMREHLTYPFPETIAEIDSDLAAVKAELQVEMSAGRKQEAGRSIAAIAISLIMVSLFELFVYVTPISYVRNHPHTYGIQGSIICLIPCLSVGFFKPRLRKWCWGSAAIAILVGLLSLL